jgi:hypothetical protein
MWRCAAPTYCEPIANSDYSIRLGIKQTTGTLWWVVETPTPQVRLEGVNGRMRRAVFGASLGPDPTPGNNYERLLHSIVSLKEQLISTIDAAFYQLLFHQ